LNNQGKLLSHIDQYEPALKSYNEALEISLGLSKKNPNVYLAEVALNLNKIGNLHSRQKENGESIEKDSDLIYVNDYGAALKSYNEALEISRGLAKKNPNTYLPIVAATLNNLGDLLSYIDDYEEAVKSYKEALEIGKKLAKKTPEIFLRGVAQNLDNLGYLHYKFKIYNAAIQAYTEALSIRKKLAAKNPKKYLHEYKYDLTILSLVKSLEKDKRRR